MRCGVYCGSFNPFTTGHDSIVRRALTLFDEVVIGVGVNITKAGAAGEADERVAVIRRIYADEPRVRVESFACLAVEFAAKHGAKWLIRGVRSAADFEAERTMADANRAISGIDTLLLPALPELGFVSSSMVRELKRFGQDISDFLPKTND